MMARTGCSKSKIYRDVKAGRFPAQASKLEGSTSAGWIEDDIDAHLEARRPGSSNRLRNAVYNLVKTLDAAQVDPSQFNRGRSQRVTPSNLQAHEMLNIGSDSTLISTGMRINGAAVYCHRPSRKLLVEVGSISAESLAKLES